nr:helix-turn-helix transcriptional regulator [Actinopolyspora sp. BKK1]
MRERTPGSFRTSGPNVAVVPQYRISEVAELVGVSDDTVRRWVDDERLSAEQDPSGRLVVEGSELAEFARARATSTPDPSGVERSARNRFVGLVTEVVSDRVMSQVELQCGSQRVVSLMSTEAVTEMGLRPGVLAVAVVKSTAVVVEKPGGGR